MTSYKEKINSSLIMDFMGRGICRSPTEIMIPSQYVISTQIPPKRLGQNTQRAGSPLCRSSLIIIPGGSYSMILEAASELAGCFQYDDIIPLLKERFDWLPKEATLERYIRTLCEYGQLTRIKKGTYQKK